MIRFFAMHPTAANLLMILLVAAGLINLSGLRRETFPDFRPREVEIRVPYPGATALDVEEAVCRRVEDAIDGVRFVEEIRCDARPNVGIITVEMTEGGDYAGFKDEIDTNIASIDEFPDQVEEPIIRELNTTDLVMALLVSGPLDPADLKTYTEGLKDRLQELPDISLVEIDGFSDRQLRVELASEAMLRYGVSPSDVASSIARQSLDVPAGAIETTGEELLVRVDEERRTVDELADLVVIGGESGAEVRIGDLGRVLDDFEMDERKIVHNGRRAALLRIKKTNEQDSLTVAATLKEFLDAERARQPQVELIVTQDISTLVSDRLSLLVTNGWQGMLLVFAVMAVFFRPPLSFWVVASLPISFLGALAVAPAFDITINMLSMVGLLLAVGILMDDGIVIAENIAAHRARGAAPMRAAIDGVGEVAAGVFASFVTTACVLGPLAFLSGNIGRVLEVVPLILLLVLAFSLVEAFMILPSHLGHSLKGPPPTGRFRRAVDGALDRARRGLGAIVDRLIARRYLWLGTVGAVFLGSLALPAGGIVKFQALPELEGDTIVARVLMPQGTPLEQTERVVDQLTRALEESPVLQEPQKDGQPLIKTVYVRYDENLDVFETGSQVATIYVDLLAAQDRTIRLDDVFDAWRDQAGPIADAESVSFTEPTLGPAGRNLEIRVRGPNLEEIRQVSLEMKDWFARYPGVTNMSEDVRPGRREYVVRTRPGALRMDVDASSMAGQLRAAFEGQIADEIQVGGESYEVSVRFDPASQASIRDLDAFRFTRPDGQQVPLASVARLDETRGWSRIARIDGQRTVTLRGDVDSQRTNTEALLSALQAEYLPAVQERHPDVTFELEGETAEAAKTRGSMVRGMGLGMLGIFILLSFQFRSYVEPLIVMVAIPFALVGVIWGHLLMGYDLTMPGILGFIALSGVVVNDSILLVVFLKRARAEGVPSDSAAGRASRERFRAILMTSLTTVAGLLPLMFERSLQAQILIPLAISIVFGLIASTLLVLLVIPCLYVVLDDFGLTARIDRDDDPNDEYE